MRTRLAVSAFVCLLASPALAQTSTSTSAGAGIGVGIAGANSQSGAIAISGQGGAGGQGGVGTVNIGGTPAQQSIDSRATVNSNATGDVTSRVISSGTTTSNINQRVSGTQTIRSAPPIAAPGLAAAGLETCLGSASGGVSAVGFGITGGASIVDEGCQARLDSRTLFYYGLKSAAVARLCQRADIWRSMPDVCAQYWPPGVPYPNGIAVQPAGYVAPLPVRALMSATGIEGETIRVIDGRDGIEKDCLNYNAAKQKCLHWAGEKPRRQRVAAVNPSIRIAPAKPSAKKLAPATAVANSPAVGAIESATTGQPQ